MTTTPIDGTFDTIVIGAGQAGLSAGYYLKKRGIHFIILGSETRVGDTWRKRWDSLRLFTPARYSSLPGMPFPGSPDHLPTKDEMADYFESYARHFLLPIRLNTRVRTLSKEGDWFLVRTDDRLFRARVVIVATGAFQKPSIPAFAGQIDSRIQQVHSSGYQRPEQLPAGPTLVVGAGNSGAQIALELAASREVWLAGPDLGRLPRSFLGRDIFTWIWSTVLNIPIHGIIGRLLGARRFSGGDPLIGVNLKTAPSTLLRAGRVVYVQDGKPVLDSGEKLDVSSIVWCTGFKTDFNWINLNIFDSKGLPRHTRGVVHEMSGLYFLGLRHLSGLKSSTIGGVGGDAAYITTHLHQHMQVAPTQQIRPVLQPA